MENNNQTTVTEQNQIGTCVNCTTLSFDQDESSKNCWELSHENSSILQEIAIVDPQIQETQHSPQPSDQFKEEPLKIKLNYFAQSRVESPDTPEPLFFNIVSDLLSISYFRKLSRKKNKTTLILILQRATLVKSHQRASLRDRKNY